MKSTLVSHSRCGGDGVNHTKATTRTTSIRIDRFAYALGALSAHTIQSFIFDWQSRRRII